MGTTALITGCSSGVGRAAAREFLADGWEVYATARDPNELAALGDAGARTAALDVTSTEDAVRVVERVVEERGRLDCLVNNAGFGQMGPVEDVPIDKVREQYEVNVFGPYRLMRAALPHMRDSGSGTIINVTSITDRYPIAGNGVYSGSKSALATVSRTVRQEVREHGIDVVVVEPTAIATDFYDRVRDELVDVDHKAAYTDLYEVLELLHTVKSGGPGIASPETVAETMLEAANSDAPKRRYEVGSAAKAGTVIEALLPESLRTPATDFGVRIATSYPARRFLLWWFARHHRASEYQNR
ncbi:SDR family oxidoreductase [Haladaptatus salinisoli]|uniref:SDR family oxidoreductase n=1 Tax=Haladaptatus salinisoli TaxID=2884876 RepID=UPI001D0AA176|nr:SDR family oxidoreductase [Haladaptatus salinisoli]